MEFMWKVEANRIVTNTVNDFEGTKVWFSEFLGRLCGLDVL